MSITRTIRLSRVAIALALLLSLTAGSALAAGGDADRTARGALGVDFRIVGTGARGEDRSPAMVWNGAGQYLVVWQDGRHPATRGTDIYARRLATDGTWLGDDFRISGAAATTSEMAPAVAWNDATDEYLVVWQDSRKPARGWDIYGQRVTVNGVLVGPNFRISGRDATTDDGVPAVAWNDATDRYLVVWQDNRNAQRGLDIFGQQLSATGAMVGANFRISSPRAVADDQNPAVVWNASSDEYLVVWQDMRNFAIRGWDIYGRRISATGSLLGTGSRIGGSTGIANDISPAAAWNATTNRYLVVWGDQRDPRIRGWDIFGREVAADGSPAGRSFRISGAAALADEWWPAVAWNSPLNRYLVVWEDERHLATRGSDIRGRHVGG